MSESESLLEDDAVNAAFFGDRAALALQYAALLRGPATTRGLLGPREGGKLWDRHLLNCLRVQSLLRPGSRLVDVGSGAGLPGLVLAIARPDVEVVLIEPLLRRATFLQECVAELGLTNVGVVRARAEDQHGVRADAATARAVAPLEKLARWCLPLVVPGGALLAMKGASAATELAASRPALMRLGMASSRVHTLTEPSAAAPTVVVEIVTGARAGQRARRMSR